jgi:hypothetical protein
MRSRRRKGKWSRLHSNRGVSICQNRIEGILRDRCRFSNPCRNPSTFSGHDGRFVEILTKIGLANASNVIDLPWGARLRIDAKDTVGRALAAQGVYDVVTTEVLWRLTEDAATAFDVGANIGYFTSLLARRVGPKGRVLAFEPHPETLRLLRRNVSQFTDRNVQVENVALSDVDGEGSLDNFSDE